MPKPMDHPPTTAPGARIALLDLARAVALLAMALYHFVFDLELFGVIAQGSALQPGWRWLAYLTAGSFLCLAGMSLWLAHGSAIRWPGFWQRFAMIAGAALAITAGSALAMPDAFIFFGILHAIAVSSLLGLLLLRVPPLVLIGGAIVVLALPQWMRLAALDAPWFWWTGLQAIPLRSLDYVPLFPWFAPFLLGLAVARLMAEAGLWARLARWQPPPALRLPLWAGRNSLVVYLAHQPILIALIWGALQLRG